ncbi:MAG: peptidoglycan bridge formation glycyltransferase FemA/FemB family protein [Patescibacteria group bacterium]|nr:peptidoglycan bridge formation glycyltransferase FemA/FemB family protein [Patescibacteria group bacterium]
MVTREILFEDKDRYNQFVNHPLQSYEWGEFRKSMGINVIRLGTFSEGKLVSAFQFSLHRVPGLGIKVAYLPKGPGLTAKVMEAVKGACLSQGCAFVKLEPNIEIGENEETANTLSSYPNLVAAKHPLFTKYTFYLDLTKDENELLSQMKEKTRYNVRLAQKKGVTVKEDNSAQAFEKYLQLLKETARRDKFYAHDENYHRKMWEIMRQPGIARLFTASFDNQILVAWVMFVWKKFLYYAYGASSSLHREVMASNLMYYQACKLGKNMGLTTFDLWGALGPNPDTRDPFYGFHRFKEGYGPRLVEFVGSYDLILNQPMYQLFHTVDSVRWRFLKLRQKLPF